MSIRFMRWVDYWLGIPLTAILGCWLGIAARVRRETPLDSVRNVLFVELSEMGSVILAHPALRRVGERHALHFAIFQRNAPSLAVLNPVPPGNVFRIRDSSLTGLAWDTMRLMAWCRRRRIDAVVDLELFSRYSAVLSALSGAAVRIGFTSPHAEGIYRGRILTHGVAYNPRMHIAKNFLALCDPLLDPKGDRDGRVRRTISDAEIALVPARPPNGAGDRVRDALAAHIPDLPGRRPILLVNANAGDFLPQRKWPRPHVARFVTMFLAANPEALVLLTGSQTERADLEEVAQQAASPRCVNIAGVLPVEDLPALYALADAMVTNDSGPAHFAAAVGLCTFVLFGPETPELYRPLGASVPLYAGLACSPCVSAANHRRTDCTDNQCLKAMSPEWVLAQVQGYLDRRAGAGRGGAAERPAFGTAGH